MRPELFSLGIILTLITILTFSVLVTAAADTQDITVNVTQYSEITVYPSTLNWTQIPVGHAGSEYGGVNNTTIINTGSVNVSGIYLSVDTLADESSRPYGTDDASNYAAGGVITIKNETNSGFYFAGRIEWNWTKEIAFSDFSAVEDANTDVAAWGYLKNATNEYVWVVGANSTNGRCNETDAELAIETDPDDGTTPTRTPTDTDITYDSGDENYGYFFVGDRLPVRFSCVAVAQDCSKIYIYKYDQTAGFNSCDAASYLHAGQLAPGSDVILRVDVWIPKGIPYGDLSTATVTITAG